MDGLLTFDALDYHPEASNAYKAHLAQRNQKAYYAGPLIPARHPAPPAGDARGAQESMQFLERQLEERGVRSVIYVSFGSQYWPQDPAKLAAALDLLVEQKIPFIMSRPSAAAKLSDDLIQRLSGNPDIYLGNWLPQQAILDHPATGWCLTHGGHNTVLECIHFGIPMMIWPITADQPVNAVHLSYNAKMAYELIEVRNGVGAGVIHRTGKAPLGTIDAVRDELRSVLARAFGEDGAAKRQRVLRLREVLAGAWAENGVARREVGEFLDDVTTMPAA
ncbi:hypothetical protein BN946_scf184787.g21 [Trametes cinnabarina]|uniref:Glycosyltransferase Family 1 protein n=1 Tax=Pycnoporus cinnabarinus TaxID=5643 RepID=A0A060SS72_PYCCI|nr:hypothetical protein BN946_scf184787.g21 [Trametes cinnabarina]